MNKLRIIIFLISLWSISYGQSLGAQTNERKPLDVRTLLSIPFGVKESTQTPKPFIGERDLSRPGEGYPTAFRFSENGNFHLLIPSVNEIFVFTKKGAFLRTVTLTNPQGAPLPPQAFLFDFVIEKNGSYLILDQSGGWITRFDRSGKAVKTFGHLIYGAGLALSDKHELMAVDSALSLINVFNEKDEFVKDIKGPNLYPEQGRNGNFVRSTNLSFKKSILWLRPANGNGPRVLKVIGPEHETAKLYEATPIGFDSMNRIVTVTTEKTPDKSYYSYIHFIDSRTNHSATYEVPPNMELVTDIPRAWLLNGNDEIVTFRTRENTYEILVYTEPKK